MKSKTNLFRLKTKGSTCKGSTCYYVINGIGKELIVTAIRGEFIYCKESVNSYPLKYKFQMDDGWEVTVYGCGGRLYPSKDFYENEEASRILHNKIIKMLPYRLDTLRKIEALIINEDIVNSKPNVNQIDIIEEL